LKSRIEKITWAKNHRAEGNILYESGYFQEATDVYLTCLVALDVRSSSSSESSFTSLSHSCSKVDKDDKENCDEDAMELEIKIPVLMNLSACAMKMGTYSKAEIFCNHALESPSSFGKKNAKLWYRRGKARMCKGDYDGSNSDFNEAMQIVNNALTVKGKIGMHLPSANDVASLGAQKLIIKKDMEKLDKLIEAGKVNAKTYKNAMKQAFQNGCDSRATSYSEIEQNATLNRDTYATFKSKRAYSNLRAKPSYCPPPSSHEMSPKYMMSPATAFSIKRQELQKNNRQSTSAASSKVMRDSINGSDSRSKFLPLALTILWSSMIKTLRHVRFLLKSFCSIGDISAAVSNEENELISSGKGVE